MQQFIPSQVYHDSNKSMELRHKPFGLNNQTSMQCCAMYYHPVSSMIMFSATNACIAQLYNALRLGCNIPWLDLCEAYTVLNNLPLLHDIKFINYVWDNIKSTLLCDVPFKVKVGLETNACMHNPSMPWLLELLASTDSVLGNIMSNVLLLYDTNLINHHWAVIKSTLFHSTPLLSWK